MPAQRPHPSRAHAASFSLLPVAAALATLFAAPVHAQDFTVATGTTRTTTSTIAGGAGVVEAGGKISVGGGDRGVRIRNGVTTLTNAGTIEQTGTGRAIDVDGSNATVYILNSGLITSSGAQVIRFDSASTKQVLDNQGTIWHTGVDVGGERAIKADGAYTTTGNQIVNGSGSNRSAVIRSNGNDAIRLGNNFTLTNWGDIFSTGRVNTSCPDYQANDVGCGADLSAADGVAIENGRRNAVILNHGTITGPRHGVDGGDPIAYAPSAHLVNVEQLIVRQADGDGVLFDVVRENGTTESVRVENPVIINYAGGTITGNNGSGVGIDGHAVVINHGTITGNYAGAGNIFNHPSDSSNGAGAGLTIANGDGDGVDIDGTAYIENWGTIRGTGAGGFDSGNNPNGADGIAAGGGTIINHTGAVIFGQTKGILIDDGAAGTAVAAGRGTADAQGAAAIIVNDGRIEGATGVAIGLVGDFADRIENGPNGVIIGGLNARPADQEGSTAAAAAVQMGAGNDLLINAGRIEGRNGLAIDLGSGDDTLRLLAGSTIVGTIDGGQGIDLLQTQGTQRFAAGTLVNFERFTVQAGTTTFDYALGAVDAVTVNEGATLRVNGGFSTAHALTVNGVLAAPEGNTLRTLAVGSYSQGAHGVLEARVGASGQSDRIVASQTADLHDGATLSIRPLGYVTSGSTWTLVSATTLGADADALRLINDSALVKYSLAVSGHDLVLSAERTATLADVAPAGLGSLGRALDTLGANSPMGNTLLARIDGQGTAAGVAESLRQLSPDTSGAVRQAAQMTAAQVFGAIADRMDQARGSAVAQGPARGLSAGNGTPGRAWVQGLGAWGEQKARAGNNGFDLEAWGLAAGMESDRGAQDVMGLSLGLNQARADGVGAGTGDDVRVKSTSIGGYLSRTAPDLTVDASVLAGYNRYDTRRAVTVGGVTEQIRGDFDGWQVGGQVELGFPFQLRQDLSGRWLVGGRANYLSTGSYTEQGGASALSVNSANATSLQSVLGAELNWATAPRSAVQLRARWLHEFGDAPDLNAAFATGGPGFTTPGIASNRDALQLGVGLRHDAGNGVTLNLRYDAEVKRGYVGHQLSARAVWTF
ncbi:MAG: autotransporter outer membrane beta-barrel domain-containing protein [Burkholderiaceae bacterium]|nr:autotransporter outer membrane beta-barrel domain-containing protein [Burkholderiaceae bacterium]